MKLRVVVRVDSYELKKKKTSCRLAAEGGFQDNVNWEY